MRKEGKLFVISGPSGVGKDTVIARILQKNDNVALSVSCTTRAPRGQEKDGEDRECALFHKGSFKMR